MYSQLTEPVASPQNRKSPIGPVPERIQRILDVQFQIEETLTGLEERLEFVCPSEPENSGPEKETAGPSCLMEESLMGIERRLIRYRDRITSLLRRLKL